MVLDTTVEIALDETGGGCGEEDWTVIQAGPEQAEEAADGNDPVEGKEPADD